MRVGEHFVEGTPQQKLHGDSGSVADRLQKPVLMRRQIKRHGDLPTFHMPTRRASPNVHAPDANSKVRCFRSRMAELASALAKTIEPYTQRRDRHCVPERRQPGLLGLCISRVPKASLAPSHRLVGDFPYCLVHGHGPIVVFVISTHGEQDS